MFGRVAETIDDLNGDGFVNDQDVMYILDLLDVPLGDITLDGVANTEDGVANTEDVNLFLDEGTDVDNDGDIDMWDYFDFFFY